MKPSNIQVKSKLPEKKKEEPEDNETLSEKFFNYRYFPYDKEEELILGHKEKEEMPVYHAEPARPKLASMDDAKEDKKKEEEEDNPDFET